MNSVKQLNRVLFLTTVLALLLAGCGGAPGENPNFNIGGPTEVDDGVRAISFESATPDQIALKGQGGIENSIVTFKVTDTSGNPLGGVPVSFSIDNASGGVNLRGQISGVPSANNGEVSVSLESGTVSTVVRVIARISGSESQAISPEITVSTGIPVARLFSIGADPSWAVPRTLEYNGIEVAIRVTTGDQFGNPVFDGTKVSFWSPYSGIIDASCLTSGGRCEATWLSAHTDWVHPENPRLVPILAYANGAEVFTDTNGNYIYDVGESFVDLGEAFLDLDFDGEYDNGEYFVDANQNQVRDGGNGVYDGPCLSNSCEGASSTIIWTQNEIYLCPENADSEPDGSPCVQEEAN